MFPFSEIGEVVQYSSSGDANVMGRKAGFRQLTLLWLLGMLAISAAPLFAADVDLRVSAREGYVDMPIVMEITIKDASDYQTPEIPTIDGLKIEAAGPVSQSSRIMIINGRRTQSQEVVLRYLLTPTRVGEIQWPELKFMVDNELVTMPSISFSIKGSETGDLLFVDVVSDPQQVFVGQPLQLTLQIWLKPFEDSQRNLKISASDMWQMISDQTEWGVFGERLQELANQRRGPNVKKVMRATDTAGENDTEGENAEAEQEYYLYEVTATIYPTRVGQISSERTRIVVNYPTELSESRDLFARGLRVSEARPISAEVSFADTEVLPIPTAGRPDDYRGAVGRYSIRAQASPLAVAAGDPINLSFAIQGSGPLQLVQAPPLAELDKLTADFKVPAEPLAGFVRDGVKYFSTMIRPRRAGVPEIPEIPFTFFDPEAQTFETVTTEAIAIAVSEAESLQFADIVSANPNQSELPAAAAGQAASPIQPEFTNEASTDVLTQQSPVGRQQALWMTFVVGPPALLVLTLLLRGCVILLRWSTRLQPAHRLAISKFQNAEHSGQLLTAMGELLIRSFPGTKGASAGNVIEESKLPGGLAGEDLQAAQTYLNRGIGGVRLAGLYALAAELEAWATRVERVAAMGEPQQDFQAVKQAAEAHVDTIRAAQKSSRNYRPLVAGMLLCLLLSGGAKPALAEESLPANEQRTQQELVLAEATELYRNGLAAQAAGDQAEASVAFAKATAKYQWLIDQEIFNSALYRNLANAELQAGQTARAIAHYELALRIDPGNSQAWRNLQLARQALPAVPSAASSRGAVASFIDQASELLHYVSRATVALLGPTTLLWIMAIASLSFWGLLIVRVSGIHFAVLQWALLPLFILLPAVAIWASAIRQGEGQAEAILVVDEVVLRGGDDDQFAVVTTMEQASGQQVRVLGQRNQWLQIQTITDVIGWIPAEQAIGLTPPPSAAVR